MDGPLRFFLKNSYKYHLKILELIWEKCKGALWKVEKVEKKILEFFSFKI